MQQILPEIAQNYLKMKLWNTTKKNEILVFFKNKNFYV